MIFCWLLIFFFKINFVKKFIRNTNRVSNSLDLDQARSFDGPDLAKRERSGSVVECLTRDRGDAGSSLTGVTALWSLSKTHLS